MEEKKKQDFCHTVLSLLTKFPWRDFRPTPRSHGVVGWGPLFPFPATVTYPWIQEGLGLREGLSAQGVQAVRHLPGDRAGLPGLRQEGPCLLGAQLGLVCHWDLGVHLGQGGLPHLWILGAPRTLKRNMGYLHNHRSALWHFKRGIG